MLRQKIFSYFQNENEALVHIASKTSYSYKELGEVVAGLAENLKSQGLKEQGRLAFIADNSLETALIYLSCMYARIVVCPINGKASEEEQEYCLNLLKPDLFLEKLDFLDQIEKQAPKPQNYQADDVLTITFTSGSTGNPKAIMHKAEILLANGDAMNRYVGSDQDARFFHVMPMYYMAGILNTILCPIMAGGTLVISDGFSPLSPMTFWQQWLDNRANTTWISPTMAASLIKLDRDKVSIEHIKKNANKYTFFCGTAPLSLEVKELFKEKFNIDLIESYGLSEILFVSAKDPKNNTYSKSVGKLIDGVRINIQDTGELEFVTDYPMIGYLAEDGSTYGIEGNKFSSGDIGETVDGELFITGRIKDLIIKGGINISPRQIEEQIEKLQGVKQVAVVGYADDFFGENIACFVSGKVSEAELRAFCKENLAENKMPAKYFVVELIPMGPTGKIQKNKLAVK